MKKKKKTEAAVGPILFAAAVIGLILITVVASSRQQAADGEKEESEAAPSPSAGPSAKASLPSLEEVFVTEDGNAALTVKSDGYYSNAEKLEIQTGYGRYISLGLGNGDIRNAVYLNPHMRYDYAENPDEQYGFLIRTDRVPLEYADTVPAPGGDPKNTAYTDLAILGRTYDKLAPAAYTDPEQFGVRWIDSPAFGGQPHDGDTLYILAVRISDGTLMGAGRADIIYDYPSNTYSIRNFRNSDILYTGELPEKWRDRLYDDAVTFIERGNEKFHIGFSGTDWNDIKQFAVIEKLNRTYYRKFFNTLGNVTSSGRYAGMDIYAVNINCSGYGYFTVYFCPEPMAYGLHTDRLGNRELNLIPIGYDAHSPMSVELFKSYLLEEDAKALGAEL